MGLSGFLKTSQIRDNYERLDLAMDQGLDRTKPGFIAESHSIDLARGSRYNKGRRRSPTNRAAWQAAF
jgi:hypothetical protein